ncbi:hypothetical protein JRQ81_019482 [Phrynocephalus forsythii]|uniref:Uncharacterized protein n=1 Tax=Phrynocephalus forsythii TaxID=171643 RepID=A0A9Q1AYJ7_9SAUR|nr:hypothetical protein JRQ81_019482 [Phrynocephalus forsythii]
MDADAERQPAPLRNISVTYVISLKFPKTKLFWRCLDITNGSGIILCDYWKHYFDTVSCLLLIKIALDGISQTNLSSAWCNLWPDCVVCPDSNAPEPAVVQDIVSLGKLEVSEEDITKLVEGHYSDLTTLDLMGLQQEVMEEEQVSLEEEEVPMGKHVTSVVLKEVCQLWRKLQNLVNQHHPHLDEAQNAVDNFDNVVMSPLRGMLERHQRQQTMDRFLNSLVMRKNLHDLVLPTCPSPPPLPKNDGIVSVGQVFPCFSC